jgi:hypothetical protein
MFYENGWCFGCKASDPSESGFIPINHIYIMNPEDEEEPEPEPEIEPPVIKIPERPAIKTIQKSKKEKKWMNYVNSLLEDNAILSNMLNDDTERNNQYLPYSESTFGYENF